MKKPFLGQKVIYKADESDKQYMRDIVNCNVQDELPATVVAVWSEECVNLKVHMDGDAPDLWKTSAQKGTGECEWQEIAVTD